MLDLAVQHAHASQSLIAVTIPRLKKQIHHMQNVEIHPTTAPGPKIFLGPVGESNPGPLAPKARIMPLDQQAFHTITVCELKSNYEDDGYQSILEKLIK